VIVNDFNLVRAIGSPHEADAPLVIDTNAVLALPLAFQGLELVAWGNPQAGQVCCGMQLQQLSPRHTLDILEPRHNSAVKQRLGVGTHKRMNHASLCSVSRNSRIGPAPRRIGHLPPSRRAHSRESAQSTVLEVLAALGLRMHVGQLHPT